MTVARRNARVGGAAISQRLKTTFSSSAPSQFFIYSEPDDILGLVGWWKGATGVTASGGGGTNVTKWVDLSGLGNDMVNTGSSVDVMLSGAFSGSLKFDSGNAMYMTGAMNGISSSTGFTLFVVFEGIGSDNNKSILSIGETNQPGVITNNIGVLQRNFDTGHIFAVANDIEIFVEPDLYQVTIAADEPYVSRKRYVFSARYVSGSNQIVDITLNGNGAQTVPSRSAAFTDSMTNYTLSGAMIVGAGWRTAETGPSPTTFWPGYVFEVAVYKRPLTLDEIASLTTFYTLNYNIS